MSNNYHDGKPMPSQQEIRELFDYDDDIGALRWKVARQKINVGDVAGSLRKDGYMSVKVDGEIYLTHRLIWVYHKGEIPSGKIIDHINDKNIGLPRNSNKIENLQLATQRDNSFKAKMRKDNTSGASGVSWHKGANKWRAQYRDESGKVTHIGHYTNIFDAYYAYREKAKQVKKRFLQRRSNKIIWK